MEPVDDDEEYEYEESTVMVELQGIMENDFLGQVSQAKILGIDTEKPLLQLDDYTFTGKYLDTMGTDLLFEDKSESNDPKAEEKKLEYSCLTNKKLCLQRVFLKKNEDLTHMDTTADGIQNERSVTESEPDKTSSEQDRVKPGTSTENAAIDDTKPVIEQTVSKFSADTDQNEEMQEKT